MKFGNFVKYFAIVAGHKEELWFRLVVPLSEKYNDP